MSVPKYRLNEWSILWSFQKYHRESEEIHEQIFKYDRIFFCNNKWIEHFVFYIDSGAMLWQKDVASYFINYECKCNLMERWENSVWMKKKWKFSFIIHVALYSLIIFRWFNFDLHAIRETISGPESNLRNQKSGKFKILSQNIVRTEKKPNWKHLLVYYDFSITIQTSIDNW